MPVDENYKRSQSGNMARRQILEVAINRSIKRKDLVPRGVPRKLRRIMERAVKKNKSTIKEIE